MHVPDLEKSGLVYSMKCVEPCQSMYIGETKRVLRTRIMEHNRIKSSAIKCHIDNCEHFKSHLNLTYGVQPTPNERLKYLETLFKPICTNANNYHSRKRLEAIAITVTTPDLNNQIIHKKVHIINKL